MNIFKKISALILSIMLMLPSYTTAMDERPTPPSRWLSWQTGVLTGATVSILTLAWIWRATSKKPAQAAPAQPLPAAPGFTSGFKSRAGERVADAAYYTLLLSTIAAGGSFIWNLITGKNAALDALDQKVDAYHAETTASLDAIRYRLRLHTHMLCDLQGHMKQLVNTTNGIEATQGEHSQTLAHMLSQIEILSTDQKLNALLLCLPEEHRMRMLPTIAQAIQDNRPILEIEEIQTLIRNGQQHLPALPTTSKTPAASAIDCSALILGKRTPQQEGLDQMKKAAARASAGSSSCTLTITPGTPPFQALPSSRH